MFTKKILQLLCTIALVISLATISNAIQVYPVDYTFTGFGKPGTTAAIDITDSTSKVVTFSGVVKADGTYSIPAKIATKDGQLAIKVETDEALDATVMFYDLTTLDTSAGFKIAPAIYAGTGATPNGNVKIEFPDGSSTIQKADATGNFEVIPKNAQPAGPITATNLDSLGLEVGTPIAGTYDGGIEVVTATQAAKAVAPTPPPYIAPVIDTKPVVVTPPATTPQAVTPAASVAKTATVRTGGIMDYAGYVSLALIAIGTVLVFRKKSIK
jgi:hypothetical protein